MKIGRIEVAWAAEALRPAVGWKVWRVDEQARLRSVLYGDPWPLDAPVEATCKRLGARATLRLWQDADHSFHVPARTGRKDPEVRREVLDALAAWIDAIVAR